VRRNVAAADIAAGSARCENVNSEARTVQRRIEHSFVLNATQGAKFVKQEFLQSKVFQNPLQKGNS
jgi:hypothetical protein